jgi:hypothetical protein
MKKKNPKRIPDNKNTPVEESKRSSGKPRKYVSLLKEQGYTLAEINDCIQAMMAMDIKELTAIGKDASATILEKTVARAMIKSLESGNLNSVKALLDRAYGSPKQTIDQNVNSTLKINVRFNDDTDEPQQ